MSRLFLFFLLACAASAAPNVLIIIGDDCTYNDLPLYGGENAKTPHIDRLASQGLTFNKAYLCEAMCQPCRAALYTGLFPMGNGCAWNHSSSKPGLSSMPQHLRALGYRVGLAGKVHVKPRPVFPFANIAGFDPNCVRTPTNAHDLEPLRKFMAGDSPFCAVVALVEPHVPWVMGDASAYPPKQIKLPANIADTERTRADFGRYLAEITYMDSQIGEILGALDKSGKADDTLVLFTSEQGSQFPGCKWTNFDTGLHTALVARWPGKTPVGTRTDAIVQWVDILPTLLDLGGGKAPQGLDGSSFASVLRGQADSHRHFAYGVHNNLPEGPAYPIRSITDGEHRYIRNLLPNEIYIEKHLMGTRGDGSLNNPYWGTWIWGAHNNPHTYKLVKRYTRRPAEELYHTASDSYELTNLASNPEAKPIKDRLAAELDRWMAAQGDPGTVQDTPEVYQAARKGKHRY